MTQRKELLKCEGEFLKVLKTPKKTTRTLITVYREAQDLSQDENNPLWFLELIIYTHIYIYMYIYIF